MPYCRTRYNWSTRDFFFLSHIFPFEVQLLNYSYRFSNAVQLEKKVIRNKEKEKEKGVDQHKKRVNRCVNQKSRTRYEKKRSTLEEGVNNKKKRQC